MKHRFAVLLTLAVLLSSLLGGFLGSSAAVNSAASESAFSNGFLTNFTEALDVIQRTYVEDVGSDKLVYSAIKGMLRALDPHSNFLDPDDFARLREDQHSIYYGLGIQMRPLVQGRGRQVIVENPDIGTPAGRRGLRLGDVITQIEGEPIDNWATDEVVKHLKGPRGTAVNIMVERPGVQKPLQFRVERDEIPMTTVPYAFEVRPGIGYVKIDRFSETTTQELNSKLDQLSGISGLILDLRDNPGGLLKQAIEISDLFLNQGDLIVSTKGRISGSTKSYKAPGQERIQVPLVVLINHQSASASEIVAGALQDHDRALIVGETSFGKGLVQTVYTLSNDTGMTLTTAKYYTPSGRLIQRDYSGSSIEYYYMYPDDAPDKDTATREVRHTDSNRIVYGGGGITPDIIEPARELNRFEMMLTSKNAFFQYGRRLAMGEVPSHPERASTSLANLEITEDIIVDFKQFLRNRNIEFSEEDIRTNIDFIKRRIKQDTFISAFGIKESYKIGIQGDTQVLKALEMMPEAKSLMVSGHTKMISG